MSALCPNSEVVASFDHLVEASLEVQRAAGIVAVRGGRDISPGPEFMLNRNYDESNIC
jgi:hypothetical protein